MRRIWDDRGAAAMAALALFAAMGATGVIVADAQMADMTVAAMSPSEIERIAEGAIETSSIDESDPLVRALRSWIKTD